MSPETNDQDVTEVLVAPSRQIPPRALVLSLCALAVPVLGVIYAPDLLSAERGLLLWLSPLLPAFLLAYYRGLQGVAVALALGMASLTAANLAYASTGVEPPSWGTMFTLVVVYLVITNGVAALAELMSRERRAVERLALLDSLTGLPNRRHASLFLDKEFAAGVRGRSLAVIMFDIDHFKAVNDTYGHAVGDEALVAVSQLLKTSTRRMDLPARFGGEEFLVTLSDISESAAEGFANRMRNDVQALELTCGQITVSAGVAMFKAGMGSPEILIAAADRALYQAKESGRNCVVLASAEPPKQAPKPKKPQVRDSDAKGTVLVVDDDPMILAALTHVLSNLGYTVESADDGPAALLLLDEDDMTVDLLITDVLMPKMNGLILVDEIVRRGHTFPVIYMSGMMQSKATWPGLSGEGRTFLQKPITMEGLSTAVGEALGTPAGEPA